MISPDKVVRFKHKIEAFKLAQQLEPEADREKLTGFVLLVGSGPKLVEVGEDRDTAVSKAVALVEERDTVVFVSKLQSRFGNVVVTKDQLILTRKSGQGGTLS